MLRISRFALLARYIQGCLCKQASKPSCMYLALHYRAKKSRPQIITDRCTPVYYNQKTRLSSRGTTSIRPCPTADASADISSVPAFRIPLLHTVTFSNIPRCNRRSRQSLSFSRCSPHIRTTSEKVHPCHSKAMFHLLFPISSQQTAPVCLPCARGRQPIRNDWKSLCKVPTDVLSFSLCFTIDFF